MNIISTYPADESVKIYIDDSIVVRFDEPIEGSYVSDSFFVLYRTNSTRTVFYSQVARTVTVSSNGLEVVVTATLEPDNYYTLIVIGGSNGVKSTSGSALSSNYVLNIAVGSGYSPATPTITILSGEVATTLIDADDTYGTDTFRPSYDVFVAPSESRYSCVISSIPPDQGIGVRSLDTISLACNGTVVSGSIPPGAITLSYTILPVDPDPFSDRDIPFNIVYQNNVVGIQFSEVFDTTNREVTMTLQPGFLTVSDKSPDRTGYSLRFMGPLSPLYATVDGVRRKFAIFSQGAEFPIPNYELMKVIHEKSIMLDHYRNGVSVPQDLLQSALDYIVCSILRDIFIFGRALSGSVKSRSLLSTQVVYENEKLKDARGLIDDCMKEAAELLGVNNDIVDTIKSRVWMNRETKLYGIYR